MELELATGLVGLAAAVLSLAAVGISHFKKGSKIKHFLILMIESITATGLFKKTFDARKSVQSDLLADGLEPQ